MPSREYPPEIVDKALELGAAIGVNAAARQLAIPRGTIDGWTRHPDYSQRWAELRRVNAPKWRERAAIPLEDLVDSHGKLLAKAMKRAEENIDELEPKDLGNFIRSVAWAQSAAADAAGKLRGQPTHIVEHTHSAAQLETGLRRLLEEATAIDSTAEEIGPGE